MKRIINIFILGFLVLQLPAQVKQENKPSTLVFHVFYNDFNTAQQIRINSLKNVFKNHLWSKFGEMQMGLGFNYLKGIHRKIDFIATLDGSFTDYLYKDGSTQGKSAFLMDANAGLNLKLLTDHYVVVPYISSGLGFSLYKSKTGFYIPVGAGIQFNAFNEAFVFVNMQYRHALTSDVNDHFYYSIGIGLSIGKKKIKPAKVVEEIVSEPMPKEIIVASKDFLITVIDEATGQALADVNVMVTRSDGKRLSGLTDADGRFLFHNLAPADYTISGLFNNINSSEKIINTGKFETTDQQINITLTHNDPRFTLSGVVINKTQKSFEGGADIVITNETNHHTITLQSKASDGGFKVQLEKESDFTIVAKKLAYISDIEKISTKGLNRSATIYIKLELGIEEAQVGKSMVLNNLYFEVGKADINTSFSSDLAKLIQFLNDNPATRLEIQGHTDNTGSLAINSKLSQERANSVVNYLIQHGIEDNRLSAIGFGSSLPIADNNSAEGRTQNRRVVMKIL